MSHRRRGFTMIEILIVIGVIMLLVGIGVIAYRGLDKMAASRTTHVALDNVNAFVAEWEHGMQAGSLHYDWSNPNNTTGAAGPLNMTYQPGTPGAWDVSQNGNYRFDATRNCGYALEQVGRVPKVRQAMSGLPQKMTLVQPPIASSETRVPTVPAIVDGWRNPIMLIPAAGVQVTLDAENTSAKRDVVITSPDRRPFWMSAGPDGDFAKGDDNEYSFSK